jgi:hypothetical protein
MSNSKSALLCYTPSAPSLMTPAAGYIFTWNGYLAGNSYGVRMKNFRMEHIASDRIEGEMTYDMCGGPTGGSGPFPVRDPGRGRQERRHSTLPP